MTYYFQDSKGYHEYKTIKAARKAAYKMSQQTGRPYQINKDGIHVGTVHGNVWAVPTKMKNRYGETVRSHGWYDLSPDGSIQRK